MRVIPFSRRVGRPDGLSSRLVRAGVVLLALMWNSSFPERTMAQAVEPVRIILDTDLSTDVDDAGAIAVLHALADRGEAHPLALMHNTGYPHGVAAIEVLNRFYGRGDLPIGAFKGDFDNDAARAYVKLLADRFPHRLERDTAPDAVELYRRVLAGEEDGSVVICSIGFMTNLKGLVESEPDAHSPLDGRELVRRKVRELVLGGGTFPRSRRPGWNYSHAGATPYTQFIVRHWPGKITFCGNEIAGHVRTGRGLAVLPEDHPLRLAYESFFKGTLGDRESWDQACVLWAVRGGGFAERMTGGVNLVHDDGNNEWSTASEDPRHGYLKKHIGNAELKEIIEQLMLHAPEK